MITSQILSLIKMAITEDLPGEDITTRSLFRSDSFVQAEIVAKEPGVLAGIDVACEVFKQIDPNLTVEKLLSDGTKLVPFNPKIRDKKSVLIKLKGSLFSILASERVALNFLQHLSGIATETYRYVREIEGYKTKIMDTRKTLPGYRVLEKYAVRVAGGVNHRFDLTEAVLIKDNHILAGKKNHFQLGELVANAIKNNDSSIKVEVEVENLEQAKEALDNGAVYLLLDNMEVPLIERIVNLANGKAVLEVSGGVKIHNLQDIAKTGVDFISVGAITHSTRFLDLSLEII